MEKAVHVLGHVFRATFFAVAAFIIFSALFRTTAHGQQMDAQTFTSRSQISENSQGKEIASTAVFTFQVVGEYVVRTDAAGAQLQERFSEVFARMDAHTLEVETVFTCPGATWVFFTDHRGKTLRVQEDFGIDNRVYLPGANDAKRAVQTANGRIGAN